MNKPDYRVLIVLHFKTLLSYKDSRNRDYNSVSETKKLKLEEVEISQVGSWFKPTMNLGLFLNSRPKKTTC